jgi:hypothetical protein
MPPQWDAGICRRGRWGMRAFYELISEIERARQYICRYPITKVEGEEYTRIPDKMARALEYQDELLRELATTALPPNKDYDPQTVVRILNGLLKQE